jgi:hypothetical protein
VGSGQSVVKSIKKNSCEETPISNVIEGWTPFGETEQIGFGYIVTLNEKLSILFETAWVPYTVIK